MRRTRLVIADRHPIVLQGLMSVLAAHHDFEIVASCSSGASCLEAIRNLAPDIALVADTLPDATASEILAIANAENLLTRLVFLTSSSDESEIADGACREISMLATPETLLRSLRLVTKSIDLLPERSPELAPISKGANGANAEDLLTVLTDREREIVRLAAAGLSNKAIARQLNVSDGTIKIHLHHIYQKLDINNRTVLAALALRYGGFGALSLAALIFATMGDVHAADPNATFLDDDSITYKDLEHGVFELWTKEANPRHIIIDDPGQTFVLTQGSSSSITVSQYANSAARMEELRAEQQAVLSNFAKGYGPGGSGSSPTNLILPGLQPINYVPPSAAATQDSLPPLQFAPNPIFEPLRAPPPPPVPPALNFAAGPSLIDTAVFDSFTASHGNFTASSPRSGATLSFAVSGGIATNTTLDGISYNVSKTGLYGTLYLASATGAYAYVPNDAAVNALSAPTTESFTITVFDGTLFDSQIYTVNVNGTNDAAIISGSTGGVVAEAGGSANAAAGTPAVTGTLNDTDVDNSANTFTAVSSPAASHNSYGTFTMTAGGEWIYTLDNANQQVQALKAGQTLIDTFTVTTVDGTPQTITITIVGANDAAIISGTKSGTVVEAGGVANATQGTPTISGTLTDTDVDNAANNFTAVTTATASDHGYGTFTMTAAGVWTYTLNNDNAAVQALNTGGTLTDSFSVATADGTTQLITITINGTNDSAIISGTVIGTVTEAGGVANATAGTPTASGSLADTDVDNAANTFTPVITPAPSDRSFGSFTMTAGGVWIYTLNNANQTVQALSAGETLTDTFTITTVDGTARQVTITIAGSNDAAIITGTTQGSVTEAGGVANALPGTPTASGILTDTDVDNTANSFTAVTTATASDHGYGTFTMTAAGGWTYTLNNDNTAVQALNAGATLTDTFTVASADGTTEVITVTINGSNDAAVISGTANGAVVEAGGIANANAGTPTVSGTLTDTDVDNAPNTFTPVGTSRASTGGYGSFTITAAGVWTYTLDNTNLAVQALNVGNTLTDSFTVTTVDGTAQTVTVTIAGANDAAVIAGITTGLVIEAGTALPGTPLATGTLTDTDVDNAANTFIAVTSPTRSNGGYGTFTMTAAGVWAYTLDNDNSTVDALNVGDTLTDTFTVRSADGTTQVISITIQGNSDADPNDFDELAMRDQVTTEGSFVYGTIDGDHFAGGGNESQTVYAGRGDDTVNGTGVNDILYAGSGNDTMKGNGGDDTLYGGSGNDDINGNNGNDTIIGGFGADTLTGSNGNDTFVYLSVADSNSSRFDTITDFESGSDRINLAAFGALAFMALAASTTSVPPRTIAWIYDSATNQTVVYVNPTDQTLDIGDNALLEIHLQGIASVQEADFIEGPSAAAVAASVEGIDPALLVTTASDGTVLTTGSTELSVDAALSESTAVTDSWAVPADEGFRFQFARERIESNASNRHFGLGDDTHHAQAIDADADSASTTLVSIELPNDRAAAPTEHTFAFNHAPVVLASTVAITDAAAHDATAAGAASHGYPPAHAASANASSADEVQLALDDAAPGNSGSHRNSPPHDIASGNASPADDVTVALDGAAPGNSGSHRNSSPPDNSSATASPADDVAVALDDAAPGNSGSHRNSPPPHAATANASPADDVTVALDDAAPGNSGSHANSASSHAASANATPADDVTVALDDTGPGNGNGHGNSPPAHAASANASITDDATVALDDTVSGNGNGHGNSPPAHAASGNATPADDVTAALDDTVPGNGNGNAGSPHGQQRVVEILSAPDPGAAFNFNDQIAATANTQAAVLDEIIPAPGPDAHGNGNAIGLAVAPVEPDLTVHANAGQHNGASQASHDLLI